MLRRFFFILVALGLVSIIYLVVYISEHPVSSSKSSFQMVTVTNLPRDPRLGLLMRSAIKKGGLKRKERVVLKCETPFSWAKRLNSWRDYYSTLPRDTIILSVDAFDVIVMAPKKEILDKFEKLEKSQGVHLLFGYTDYCWPSVCEVCVRHEHNPIMYSEKQKKMIYLCAGTYIGRAGYLFDLLSENQWDDNVDDQCYFATLFLQHGHKGMELDEDNVIFQNTTSKIINQGDLSFNNTKRPVNNITGTQPCVFHFDSYHLSHKQLFREYQLLQKAK